MTETRDMYTPRDWQLMLFGFICFLKTLVLGSVHQSRNRETETVSVKRESSYSEKFHDITSVFSFVMVLRLQIFALHALVRSTMRMKMPGLCCDSALLQLRLCYGRSWAC